MKHIETFESFLNEEKQDGLKKGDLVIYTYERAGQHPLGGTSVVIALEVKDVIQRRTGKYAEVFLDGRFQQISVDRLIKTDSNFTDGQEISSKRHFSKEDLEKLKYKI